jgi:hypothetical protein
MRLLVTSDNPASTKSYDAPQLLQHHSHVTMPELIPREDSDSDDSDSEDEDDPKPPKLTPRRMHVYDDDSDSEDEDDPEPPKLTPRMNVNDSDSDDSDSEDEDHHEPPTVRFGKHRRSARRRNQTKNAHQHYNMRGKKVNPSVQFTQLNDIEPKGPVSDTASDLRNHILATGFIFSQMSAKAGVKKFGDRAKEAIVQEWKQLDDKAAFKPRSFESLAPIERKKALRSITLIKEKRCGRIKGRTVADGRSQRDNIDKVANSIDRSSTDLHCHRR